jgi:hypothetical protein
VVGHQVDGVGTERQLVHFVRGYGGQAAPADRGQVVLRGGLRRCVMPVADQPAGVVVVGRYVVAGRVEGERALPAALARLERCGQGPAAVFASPGVPVDAGRVDVAAAQVCTDRIAESARGGRGGAWRRRAA